jgi:hypothetical protein
MNEQETNSNDNTQEAPPQEAPSGVKPKRFGPGHINVDLTDTAASSCRALGFSGTQQMNEFFEREGDGLIVVYIGVMSDGIVALVAQTMSDEERQELMEVQYLVAEQMEVRRKAREEAKAKAGEATRKLEEDRRALVELGRKCRDNHAAVIEENTRLKKELKREKK